MTIVQDDNTVPSLRFKRRKTTHTKRARTDNDVPTTASNETTDAAPAPAHDASEAVQDEEDSVPNLKEILRNRKRPRDRLKDVARKPETSRTSPVELVQVEAPRSDQYAGRFAVQTGQVVDSNDAQMTVYVEARMAEQNYRRYAWPIPPHLQSTVAAIAPDLQLACAETRVQTPAASNPVVNTAELSTQAAARHGMLEEVDVRSSHKDWHHLASEPAAPKARLGRDGKPYRSRKRRNSEDVRRDQMVEAVLREAKIEYFEEAPAQPAFAGTDEDMLQRFQAEYFEAAEERQARRPAPLLASKDQPKGPKLGGSRSARAAMAQRGREEAGAKGNKR